MCGVSPAVSVTDGVTRVSVIFQSKRRVTRTAGMVATAFTLCWLPTFIMNFVRVVSGTHRVHRGHVLFEIAMFGAFINEAVNPIIYCAFDGNIRAKLRPGNLCNHIVDISGSTNEVGQVGTHNIATHDEGVHMGFRP